MVLPLIVSFLISLLAAFLIIRRGSLHAQRYSTSKPQRFHAGNVPRLGGIALVAGTSAGWFVLSVAGVFGNPFNVPISMTLMACWVVSVLPALYGGAYEDITQGLSVHYRLLLTALSAALACILLDLEITRLDTPVLDTVLLAVPWMGVVLAFLAICGLPHAFNLIDGYNGLAATVALLISVSIAHVALQLGDRQLAAMVVCLAGATGGFLFWNYPRGMIFAGDGGAYLWGLVIAISSIQLVQRHGEVSAWFPMLLLIYPVWETVFSIYRKLARGSSPGMADALHFHQLIYRRIVRVVFHDDASRRMLMRNNRTSPYLWSFTLLTIVPAVMFWNNTAVLAGFCGLFVISYVAAYVAIIRFKVPDWLRR